MKRLALFIVLCFFASLANAQDTKIIDVQKEILELSKQRHALHGDNLNLHSDNIENRLEMLHQKDRVELKDKIKANIAKIRENQKKIRDLSVKIKEKRRALHQLAQGEMKKRHGKGKDKEKGGDKEIPAHEDMPE